MDIDTDIKTKDGIFRIYREGGNPRISVRTENGGWHPIARYAGNPAGLEKAWRDLESKGEHVHTNMDGSTRPTQELNSAKVEHISRFGVPPVIVASAATVAESSLVVAEPVAVSLPRHGEMISEREMAVAVSSQWTKASQGLMEILKFGALMVKADQGLSHPNSRGGNYKGRTLKGWLSEHCPEVNYKTAHGYKEAALGLAAAAGLAEDFPLLSLMEGEAAFTEELQAAHDSVMQILATASIAFLKTKSRRGGARLGAGRPVSTPPDPMEVVAEAMRCAAELLDSLRRWVIDEDGLGNLPGDVLDTWLVSIGDVVRRGREIQSGRKAAEKTKRM